MNMQVLALTRNDHALTLSQGTVGSVTDHTTQAAPCHLDGSHSDYCYIPYWTNDDHHNYLNMSSQLACENKPPINNPIHYSPTESVAIKTDFLTTFYDYTQTGNLSPRLTCMCAHNALHAMLDILTEAICP